MTITQEQYDSLTRKIYTLLMLPIDDMGEMGNCQESAECVVNEWMAENDIEVV